MHDFYVLLILPILPSHTYINCSAQLLLLAFHSSGKISILSKLQQNITIMSVIKDPRRHQLNNLRQSRGNVLPSLL